jgi:hypothetical protein
MLVSPSSLSTTLLGKSPSSSPTYPPGLDKMSKVKSRGYLNITGTPHLAVPYALFVEL